VAAIRNLAAGSTDNKVAIGAMGGIEPVLSLVQNGTPGQKREAAGALWQLASNSTRNKGLIVASGIEPLRILAKEGTPDQKEYAIGALKCLSCAKDSQSSKDEDCDIM